MTGQELTLSILIGLLTNILVALATYHFTSRRDRSVHEVETTKRNSQIAEIAINHLNSSYLAIKKLRTDILAHMQSARGAETDPSVYYHILDGISRSLEQTRIAIMSNMVDWKHYLPFEGDLAGKLQHLLTNELFAGPISTAELQSASAPPSPQKTQAKIARRRPLVQTEGDDLVQVPEREELARALYQRDIGKVRQILSRLPDDAPLQYIIGSAGLLAQSGLKDGRDKLESVFRQRGSEMKKDDLRALGSKLVDFYQATGTETEGLSLCSEVVNAYLQAEGIEEKDKAYMINQLAKLFHGADDYAKALELEEQALTHAPNDASYLFNTSIIYEKLNDIDNAVRYAERCLATGTHDADHLSHLVEVYLKAGREEDARIVFKQLASIDDFKAQVLLMEDGMRTVLTENKEP